MGSEHNDNVLNESEYNVNDNESSKTRLTDYRIALLEEFLISGYRDYSNKQFLNLACYKLQKFMHKCQNDLNESERKFMATRLAYKDYLASPYWSFVATVYKCRANFRCERCGKEQYSNLSLHHKTYEHIGSELQYPEDMEILCAQCHMKEHNIEDGENV